MGETSGIGPESKPIGPAGTSGPKETSQGPSSGSIENAMHTPVKNLGQLKQVLIDNLGEEQGKKMFNNFVKSFAMQMITQVQHSAQQAKKAAQQMRQGPQ